MGGGTGRKRPAGKGALPTGGSRQVTQTGGVVHSKDGGGREGYLYKQQGGGKIWSSAGGGDSFPARSRERGGREGGEK